MLTEVLVMRASEPNLVKMSDYPTAEFVSNIIFGLFSVACNILLVWQNHRFMKEVK